MIPYWYNFLNLSLADVVQFQCILYEICHKGRQSENKSNNNASDTIRFQVYIKKQGLKPSKISTYSIWSINFCRKVGECCLLSKDLTTTTTRLLTFSFTSGIAITEISKQNKKSAQVINNRTTKAKKDKYQICWTNIAILTDQSERPTLSSISIS